MNNRRRVLSFRHVAGFLMIAAVVPASVRAREYFEITESTIAETQRAIREHKVTCRQLVEEYLKRIQAYDQTTRLNSLIVINPAALGDADKTDAEFKRTRHLRGLQ